MSKLEALNEWCEKFYAETNVRVHPQNVPVEVVLNDLMIGLKTLGHMIKNIMEDQLELSNALKGIMARTEKKKEVKK